MEMAGRQRGKKGKKSQRKNGSPSSRPKSSLSLSVCVCVCVSWRTQMQKAIPWPPLHLPSKTSIYFATPSSLAILLSRNPASTMEPLVSSPFSIAYHQVSLSKSMHFRVFEKMWIVYAAQFPPSQRCTLFQQYHLNIYQCIMHLLFLHCLCL